MTSRLTKLEPQVWVQEGDILLVSLREYQDDVADIVHKYFHGEARSLVAMQEIPKSGRWPYKTTSDSHRYTAPDFLYMRR